MPMRPGTILPTVRARSEAAARALIGERFGYLTVVSVHGWIETHIYVTCRCVCGEIRTHRPNTLKHRNGKRSCGCRGLSAEESEARDCFRDLVRGAKERMIDVGISFEQARNLYAQPCAYCGRVGVNPPRSESGKRLDIRLNGIDRVDNSRGYVDGNVAPCCRDCNSAKSALSADEFIRLCWRVAAHCARRDDMAPRAQPAFGSVSKPEPTPAQRRGGE